MTRINFIEFVEKLQADYKKILTIGKIRLLMIFLKQLQDIQATFKDITIIPSKILMQIKPIGKYLQIY